MRLSEAAGLIIDDIDLDAQIASLSLSGRPWRPLKTTGSTRCIPLIGESLWAAKQAVSKAHNQLLFPRYCDEKRCKADYASNALNKWLRQHVPAGCVIHSFRHSMRDRLRAVQCPYKRNNTFYFSRSIPSDLQRRFKKRKIEVSLRTKSEAKAAKSAAALSDRLERYWDSLRMEMIYSRELGLRVAPDAKTCSSAKSFSIREALALYHRLKGVGKTKLFFESSERSMRYLIDCLGHDDLAALDISDAGRFRDYLFDRGMSSSSVKRVFSSVRAVINLAIRYRLSHSLL